MPENVSRQERFPPRRTDAAPGDATAAGGAVAKRPPRQLPWETGTTEAGSFGDWLRRQREMREITLRDIADRTKISLRYLEAMEGDRFDLLPAPVFAKGFLREYARYVGLSPDDVVNHYLSVHRPEELPGDPKEDTKVRGRPKPLDPGRLPVRRNWSYGLAFGLAALALLALVATAAHFAERRQEKEAAAGRTPPPIAAPPPVAAVPPPPVAATPQPRAPLEVSLDFNGSCWVEALIDGRKRVSELRVQGEALPLEAERSILLTLGNAGAVDLQVNGYPLELGKKEGGVVRDLLIDLNTVQALKAKKEAR